MQYCSNCQVTIRGDKERCILCGNMLSAVVSEDDGAEIFPDIPPAYERHLAIRILVFTSLAIVISSFAVRMMFPTDVNWPVFVVFALVSIWIGLIVVVRKRHHIPKVILWQVAVVTLLSVFWDWQTGWRGWSIDYLVPITCVAAELVMYIAAKIIKLSIRDYITYALIDALFGIIPIIFIAFSWVKTLYPSILCIAISVIFLSAIFIFQGESIKKELNKKMHI